MSLRLGALALLVTSLLASPLAAQSDPGRDPNAPAAQPAPANQPATQPANQQQNSQATPPPQNRQGTSNQAAPSPATNTGPTNTGSTNTGSTNTGPTNAGAPAPRAQTPPPRDPDSNGDADEEEEEDEENWGVFFIELQGGYSFVNLVQFNAENFIPEAERREGSGIVGGLALGFRIYGLTIGARATIASYFGFEIGTAGLDLAFHFPVPVVQPYIRAGFGYAWMGDADYMDPSLSQTDVFGFEIDAGAGLDVKLGRVLSIGAGVDAVFLNMTRQAIRDAGMAGDVVLEEDGDAIGLQLRIHGHLTFHI